MINLLDIFFLLVLLFFIIQGSKRGPFVELLKIVQILLSIMVGLSLGIDFGNFIGEVFNRPRIITIPVSIILYGSITSYIFHILISKIHEGRLKKKKNKVNLFGILFGFISGSTLIMFIIWNCSLISGIFNGKETIIEKTHAFNYAQPIIFESTKILTKNKFNDSFILNMSNPAKFIYRAQIILSSSVIQNIINDPNIGTDIRSGNKENIKNNESIKSMLKDTKTLRRFEVLGINRYILINQLVKIGKNKKILMNMDNLRAKNLLNRENYFSLIRDPDFDSIVGEVLKWK